MSTQGQKKTDPCFVPEKSRRSISSSRTIGRALAIWSRTNSLDATFEETDQALTKPVRVKYINCAQDSRLSEFRHFAK